MPHPPQGPPKKRAPTKKAARKRAAKKTARKAARKREPGRPSRYRAEFAEQARKLCRLGATDKDIAEFFEVDERTFHRWKQSHAEFCQSLKEGKALADAEVADRLYRRATGYTHGSVKIMQDKGKPVIVPYRKHYAPDTIACIFWLKNRRPDLWRDRHEVSGPGGGPIQTEAEYRVTSEDEAMLKKIAATREQVARG